MQKIKLQVNKKTLLLGKSTVTIILLTWLFGKLDWGSIADTLQTINTNYIGASLIIFSLISLLEAFRLKVAFNQSDLEYLDYLRAQVIGSVFGNITPGQLGGDIYKVMVLKESNRSIVKPAIVMLLLRGLGLTVLLIALLISIIASWEIMQIWVSEGVAIQTHAIDTWKTFVLIGALIIVSALLFYKYVREKIKKIFVEFISLFNKMKGRLFSTQTSLLFISTIMILLVRIAVLNCLVLAVGRDIELAALVMVTTLATIGTLLPISISGIGVREGIIVVLLQKLAMPYESAILVAFISRLYLLLVALIGAMWLLNRTVREGVINVPRKG